MNSHCSICHHQSLRICHLNKISKFMFLFTLCLVSRIGSMFLTLVCLHFHHHFTRLQFSENILINIFRILFGSCDWCFCFYCLFLHIFPIRSCLELFCINCVFIIFIVNLLSFSIFFVSWQWLAIAGCSLFHHFQYFRA